MFLDFFYIVTITRASSKDLVIFFSFEIKKNLRSFKENSFVDVAISFYSCKMAKFAMKEKHWPQGKVMNVFI
jgi:hypothetical protein